MKKDSARARASVARGSILRRAAIAHYQTLLVNYGVAGYSFQQFLDNCRLALLWQLAGTVGWLSSADLDRLGGRELALVEAALGDGKLLAALQETNALAALPPK